ncbi:hypothetical protein O181_060177 [Austropuccinia psidii MF-1]|uniref:Uncharacterized protein n=1 Tax=Austropuccinia psidii MF-1 TaxID=1389203 RepID=A0A9Q3EI56_9BASI|nr:hypothetical protein [Austropuccinia psidii MF-1]
MSSVHLRDLEVPTNHPEDRKQLFRSRRSGFGKNGECKKTQRKHSHTPIHLSVPQKPQTRGLDRHGSSTSAPSPPQRPAPKEHENKDIQPGFKLGRTWRKIPKDMSQRDIFQDVMEITNGWNPTKQFKLLKEREAKIRENQVTTQAMEYQWIQKEHILNP